MELVSVIIPTYNRYKYLLNAIKSVRKQTYKNIEIIIVNDCSTDNNYKLLNNNEFYKDIIVINLSENSRNLFGYPCAGYVRNKGIAIATGKYIAFLDDDDYWLPNKLSLQIAGLKNNTNCKFSCTEFLGGNGEYKEDANYILASEGNMNNTIQMYKKYNINFTEYPEIWDLSFLKVCNSCACSSVLVEKHLLNFVGNFKNLQNGQEDYDLWLMLLRYTNCLYIKTPCLYYDNGHGDGQNY